MNEVAQLISSIGFPIFACIYMFKQNEGLQKVITELSVTLKSIDTRLDEQSKQKGV